MKDLLGKKVDSVLDTLPKSVELKLPKLNKVDDKKINLPKLKKVNNEKKNNLSKLFQ